VQYLFDQGAKCKDTLNLCKASRDEIYQNFTWNQQSSAKEIPAGYFCINDVQDPSSGTFMFVNHSVSAKTQMKQELVQLHVIGYKEGRYNSKRDYYTAAVTDYSYKSDQTLEVNGQNYLDAIQPSSFVEGTVQNEWVSFINLKKIKLEDAKEFEQIMK